MDQLFMKSNTDVHGLFIGEKFKNTWKPSYAKKTIGCDKKKNDLACNYFSRSNSSLWYPIMIPGL